MSSIPPPVIDSAKLLAFAHNDSEVEYIDGIELWRGKKDNMHRVGEKACLAICVTYEEPGKILLLFCNTEWESEGCIALPSVEEAKVKAERGYRGISVKWEDTPYSNDDVRIFLRQTYDVNPEVEWWKTICSFCGKEGSQDREMVKSAKAIICQQCSEEIYSFFQEE